MVYSGKRRPRNNKLEKVYERVDTLASKEHTENEARIVKCFVKENWAKFPSDYENTSRNQRCSSGKVENELFKHIADLCNWKTNKEYMKIASQIMILCGYRSYEKNKNRFKQKIQNYLKKEKKSPKMEGKKRKRTNKKKKIESDISDSISQVNIHGKQKQTMRTYTYYDFVNYLSPTIIHSYRKNKL